MKATPHHVRLDPDVAAEVKTIADVTGLTQLEVIRQMVRAGARAIKENNYKLQLPLHLVVGLEDSKLSSHSPHGESRTPNAPYQLNEDQEKKKKAG